MIREFQEEELLINNAIIAGQLHLKKFVGRYSFDHLHIALKVKDSKYFTELDDINNIF